MHICYEHEDTLGTKFIDINQQYILIRCKTYYLFLEFNVWPCFELWSRRPYPDLALRIQTGQDLWGQSSMHRLLSGICERRMAHSTNPCGGTREPSRLPFAPVWWISKTASCFWAVKYTHHTRPPSIKTILTVKSFWTVGFFMFFLKNSLLLTKPAFIWFKEQQKH